MSANINSEEKKNLLQPTFSEYMAIDVRSMKVKPLENDGDIETEDTHCRSPSAEDILILILCDRQAWYWLVEDSKLCVYWSSIACMHAPSWKCQMN